MQATCCLVAVLSDIWHYAIMLLLYAITKPYYYPCQPILIAKSRNVS